MTTLLITNDFGPRIGGIEAYNAAICAWLGDVVVLTAPQAGAGEFDAALPYEVVRAAHAPRLSGGGRRREPALLPDRRTARLAVEVMRRHGADRVVISAAAPLGLLAEPLRRAGARRILAVSHGHEAAWAALPGARGVLRRIARDADRFGVISSWTGARIRAALQAGLHDRLVLLPPPVRAEFFAVGRPTNRAPRFLAAARLVRRKGVEDLVDAWRLLGRNSPGWGAAPRLTIAGGGPLSERLRRRAAGAAIDVIGPVSADRMPALMAAHDVFAGPARRVLGGLVQEGFGLSYAEAAAAGLPAIGTRTGGIGDVIRPGHTGWLVEPGDIAALVAAVAEASADPARTRALGANARAYAMRFHAATLRETFLAALDGVPVSPRAGG